MHCRRYSEPALRRVLTDAGFELEYLTPFMAALFPLMKLSRWIDSLRRGRRSASDLARGQLRIVPGLNGLMDLLLRWEAPRAARRRRMPLGTSLLALARRRG